MSNVLSMNMNLIMLTFTSKPTKCNGSKFAIYILYTMVI